ncbi:UNVERIFIED_CONTAM: hypothetical protein FKN15_001141 [Acipenser sinensis]
MSRFHRCVTCYAKLPANDPHEDCVACLGPKHAALALADRTFCPLCVNFQTRTLCQRARKAVGGHSPSSGSSHTLSAPPSSLASPPVKLRLSRSPSSQLTTGQRSLEWATRHLGIEWPAVEQPRRSLFESPSARSQQPRMLPAFPDFIKEVQSTWGTPASSPATSTLVKTPTLSGLAKDPACPNKQCRITEVHLRTELGLVAQLLRPWWWPEDSFGSHRRVQEPDKVPLLDAPITPGHTVGPAVEEMLQRSAKAQEASQQMAKMWPHKPFQPKRPQEHQWRRTPPQHQPRAGGTKTSPSSTTARGQPPFVRPQRAGWRPRGGGRQRPRGSGQDPRERAQPKQQ